MTTPKHPTGRMDLKVARKGSRVVLSHALASFAFPADRAEEIIKAIAEVSTPR